MEFSNTGIKKEPDDDGHPRSTETVMLQIAEVWSVSDKQANIPWDSPASTSEISRHRQQQQIGQSQEDAVVKIKTETKGDFPLANVCIGQPEVDTKDQEQSDIKEEPTYFEDKGSTDRNSLGVVESTVQQTVGQNVGNEQDTVLKATGVAHRSRILSGMVKQMASTSQLAKISQMTQTDISTTDKHASTSEISRWLHQIRQSQEDAKVRVEWNRRIEQEMSLTAACRPRILRRTAKQTASTLQPGRVNQMTQTDSAVTLLINPRPLTVVVPVYGLVCACPTTSSSFVYVAAQNQRVGSQPAGSADPLTKDSPNSGEGYVQQNVSEQLQSSAESKQSESQSLLHIAVQNEPVGSEPAGSADMKMESPCSCEDDVHHSVSKQPPPFAESKQSESQSLLHVAAQNEPVGSEPAGSSDIKMSSCSCENYVQQNVPEQPPPVEKKQSEAQSFLKVAAQNQAVGSEPVLSADVKMESPCSCEDHVQQNVSEQLQPSAERKQSGSQSLLCVAAQNEPVRSADPLKMERLCSCEDSVHHTEQPLTSAEKGRSESGDEGLKGWDPNMQDVARLMTRKRVKESLNLKEQMFSQAAKKPAGKSSTTDHPDLPS